MIYFDHSAFETLWAGLVGRSTPARSAVRSMLKSRVESIDSRVLKSYGTEDRGFIIGQDSSGEYYYRGYQRGKQDLLEGGYFSQAEATLAAAERWPYWLDAHRHSQWAQSLRKDAGQ